MQLPTHWRRRGTFVLAVLCLLLTGCSSALLDPKGQIGVEQRSRQVCEHDRIFFIDMNMGMRRVGPKCVLGKFEPITREQADYIKDIAGVR